MPAAVGRCFPKGLFNDARESARRNVEVLAQTCSPRHTDRRDRTELHSDVPGRVSRSPAGRPGRHDHRENAYMIDELLYKLEQEGTLGITWRSDPGPAVMFHGHCHQKALIGMTASMAMLELAGCSATESGAGCCGMAGSFGYEAEHYEISRKIGEDRLFPAVESSTPETIIAIAGVSCRQQIEHFTDRTAKHMVEVLADRIDPAHQWSMPEPVAVAAD